MKNKIENLSEVYLLSILIFSCGYLLSSTSVVFSNREVVKKEVVEKDTIWNKWRRIY